eukprot:283850-Prymnesium_polylepis.1
MAARTSKQVLMAAYTLSKLPIDGGADRPACLSRLADNCPRNVRHVCTRRWAKGHARGTAAAVPSEGCGRERPLSGDDRQGQCLCKLWAARWASCAT